MTRMMRPLRLRPRRLLMAGALVTVLVALAPASAGAFQKAVWGPPYRGTTNEFALYSRMHVKLYETDIDWGQVAPREPAKGQAANPAATAYKWPLYLTQELTLAKKYKLSVMIQVKGSPAWANGGHTDKSSVAGEQEWAPTSAAGYAQFVQAVARKYPSVHMWMIWGEPTRGGCFYPWITDGQTAPTGDYPTPVGDIKLAAARYAEMLQDSYTALKKLSTKNTVIGGNTWSFGAADTQQWMQYMKLPDGRRPQISQWGINPFGQQAPTLDSLSGADQEASEWGGNVDFEGLPAVEQWTRRYFGHGLKLFLSEYNVVTVPDRTFNYYVDNGTATTWVRDALQSATRTSWISALGWINIYDTRPYKTCTTDFERGRRIQDCYSEPTTGSGLFTWQGTAKPDEAAWVNYGN